MWALIFGVVVIVMFCILLSMSTAPEVANTDKPVCRDGMLSFECECEILGTRIPATVLYEVNSNNCVEIFDVLVWRAHNTNRELDRSLLQELMSQLPY